MLQFHLNTDCIEKPGDLLMGIESGARLRIMLLIAAVSCCAAFTACFMGVAVAAFHVAGFAWLAFGSGFLAFLLRMFAHHQYLVELMLYLCECT